MASGILLDSSVIIPHLRDRFDVAAQVAPKEPLFLPLTALGELYKGVILAKVIRAVQFERLSDKSG